jgi:hypothetical protein
VQLVQSLAAKTLQPVLRLHGVADRRVLQGGTHDYAARGFLMIDSDRVALQRFAARLRW